MKVLLAASECAPLVKVGGIADVVGSLPIALKNLGVDVRIAIPFYKPLHEKLPHTSVIKVKELDLQYGQNQYKTTIYEAPLPGTNIPVYLVDNAEYISNGGIYFSPETMPSPESELERFSFFSKVISDVFTYPNEVFEPEILHCNDWHTGIIPQIMQARRFASHSTIKTVFTIHNLAYQGFSKIDVIEKLGIDHHTDPSIKWDAIDNNVDFVMQGIVGSDYVTTVSEKYAEEIQTPEFGEGLHDILIARKARVVGILNGISYEVFNPESDAMLYSKYAKFNYKEGKAHNKAKLLEEMGLDTSVSKPLIGIVSRLAGQKGLDVAADAIAEILTMGFQVVLLGTGDPFIETRFKEYNENPETYKDFRANITFSEELARKIYAASDMFLVPSRYEPCGLTQMIAMKYGSVPVVRATGGLYDTVHNMQTGFTFDELSVQAMLEAFRQAMIAYQQPAVWEKITHNCMTKDFSWTESAKKYISLYKRALI